MKSFFLSLMCMIVSLTICAQSQQAQSKVEPYQRISGIPKPPVAGTAITMTYHPEGGPLEGKKDLVVIVNQYNDYKWVKTDAALTKTSGGWVATIDIPKNCAFFSLEFQSTWTEYQTIKDNNDDKGYLYTVSDGFENPLPGGHISWGTFRKPSVGATPRYFGEQFNEIDMDALYYWYTKEVQTNLNRVPDFFPTMLKIVKAQAGENYPQAINTIIPVFVQSQDTISELNLTEMMNAYRDIKDSVRVDSIHDVILKQYPNGWNVRREAFLKIMTVKENWHEYVMDLLTRYPIEESRTLAGFQPYLYYNAMRAIATDFFSGQYDQQPFIDLLPEQSFQTLSEIYRTTVGPFHSKKAVSDDLNYPVGKVLIDLMLKKVDDGSYMDAGYSPHQSTYHAQTWLDEYLGNFADILYCRGDLKGTIEYLGKISERNRYANAATNETHLKALKQMKKKKLIDELVKKAYENNAVSTEFREIVKADYVKKNKTADGFEQYEIDLKGDAAIRQLRAEMEQRMTSAAYEPFTLRDMDGNEVSSANFADKVVVLDFWATWCGPCKSAMPGMKMAVEHYADNPNVAFYFIDTQENSDDYKTRVRDFIYEKKYPFTVLFDEDSKVMKSMNAINKSMAIPRKMILKNGRVRFTEEGYNGSPSLLADEIKAVVDILLSE